MVLFSISKYARFRFRFERTSNLFLTISCWKRVKQHNEAVTLRCSVKKVFLEISQNLQENTCARDSFLIKLQARPATLLKKSLCYSCFPVNFEKFLSIHSLQNTSGRLFLLFPHKTAYSSNNSHNPYKNADGNSKFT